MNLNQRYFNKDKFKRHLNKTKSVFVEKIVNLERLKNANFIMIFNSDYSTDWILFYNSIEV